MWARTLLSVIVSLPLFVTDVRATDMVHASEEFSRCCEKAHLDCVRDSCCYQSNNHDFCQGSGNPGDRDCFDKDGFDDFRKCYASPTNNTECCVGIADVFPDACLDLCDAGRNIDGNSATDYATCEEFRYEINRCNAAGWP